MIELDICRLKTAHFKESLIIGDSRELEPRTPPMLKHPSDLRTPSRSHDYAPEPWRELIGRRATHADFPRGLEGGEHCAQSLRRVAEPLKSGVAEYDVEFVSVIDVLGDEAPELDIRVERARFVDHTLRDVRADHPARGGFGKPPGYVSRPACNVESRFVAAHLEQVEQLARRFALHQRFLAVFTRYPVKCTDDHQPPSQAHEV